MPDSKTSSITSVATWSGAGLSGVGAFTFTEWLAIGGFLLALGGFIVNFWHKSQMLKIERERLNREYPYK